MNDVICRICLSPAIEKVRGQTGYVRGQFFTIFTCEYCDLEFAAPAIVPPGLYDQIYRHAAGIPGYRRYSFWHATVKKQADPLAWLAIQEPAFHFLRSELRALAPGSRILEIGCGLGYLAYAIRSAGYDITSIDISGEAVAKAKASFGDFYEVRDIFDLARETANRYDAVIACELIEHLEDPVSFFKAAGHAVRPGGKILITTPNKSAAPLQSHWLTELPPVHLWWFSETAIRMIAKALGMSVRLFDFSAMNLGRAEPPREPHRPAGEAWLDGSGAITDAASRWIAAQDRQLRRSARRKRLLAWIWPYLQRYKRRRAAARLGLEKCGTMGVILTTRE